MTRQERLVALREEFPGDVCSHAGLYRFALVEYSALAGSPERYITTHASMTDAADYHDNQEYAGDWTVEVLVDLDTGERFTGTTTTTVITTFQRHH